MLREVQAHRPAMPRACCEGLARMPDAWGAGRGAGRGVQRRLAAWGARARGCGAAAGGVGVGGVGEGLGAGDGVRGAPSIATPQGVGIAAPSPAAGHIGNIGSIRIAIWALIAILVGMTKFDHKRPVLRLHDNAKRVVAEDAALSRRPPKGRVITLRQEFLEEVQRRLHMIALCWHKTGDVRPAVKSVNDLIFEFREDVSACDLNSWISRLFGFYIDPKTGVFIRGKKKSKHLEISLIISNKWWIGLSGSSTFRPGASKRKYRACSRIQVQRELSSIADKWVETGDVRLAVASVNGLLDQFPKLLCDDQNFAAWLKVNFDFDAKSFDGRYQYGRLRAKNLNVRALRGQKWWKPAL
jgi:hypothetical protein